MAYTSEHEKIDQARKFLDHYGVDQESMDDFEVIEMIGKIHAAKDAQAQVLSRGQAVDSINRLLSFVPKHMVGEFKGNDEIDIHNAKALGWEIFFDEKAAKASPTGASDNRVILADQILMVMPVEKYIGLRMADDERKRLLRKSHQSKNRVAETQDFVAPVFELP